MSSSEIETLKERVAALEQQVAALSKKTTKSTKTVKTSSTDSSSTTSSAGPVAWNEVVKKVWQELAAAKGVTVADDSEEAWEAFKKAAKDARVPYQHALEEASVRKAKEENKDHGEIMRKKKEAKAKRDAKKATSAPAKAPAPAAAKTPAKPVKAVKITPPPVDADAEEAEEEDEEVADLAEKLSEIGLIPKTIGGVLYAIPEEGSGEAFALDEDGDMVGEALHYNDETGTLREM